MSESIPIPLDLLAETRQALEAVLSGSAEAPRQVAKVRAKLDDCLSNKPINGPGSCSTIQPDKRQSGYLMLRKLDELRREIKKDYGLEK